MTQMKLPPENPGRFNPPENAIMCPQGADEKRQPHQVHDDDDHDHAAGEG